MHRLSVILLYHICSILSTPFFQISILHKHQHIILCIVLFFVAKNLLHALSSTHAAASQKPKAVTESEAKTKAKRAPSGGQVLKIC